MGMLLRKLRGAIGNAAVWGAAWFTGSLAILGALTLSGIAPPGASLEFVLRLAANVGVTGFIAGGGLSALLGTAYRHHRIEDLHVGRVALGGALVAGLLSPLVSIAAIGLGGSGIGVGFLAANAFGSALFGGMTAGGTIKLAQRSSRQLDGGGSADLPRAGAPGNAELDAGAI